MGDILGGMEVRGRAWDNQDCLFCIAKLAGMRLIQAAVRAVLSAMQVCCSGGGTCVVTANCLAWTKWQRQLRLQDLSQTRPPAPATPADCYCPMQLTDQQRDIIRAFTVDL